MDYVKKNPNDPWLLIDRMALTAGYKENIEQSGQSSYQQVIVKFGELYKMLTALERMETEEDEGLAKQAIANLHRFVRPKILEMRSKIGFYE